MWIYPRRGNMQVFLDRSLLAIVDREERVHLNHLLRRTKAVSDATSARLSPDFDRLIALYSVHSERAFCEELEYNLIYR